VEIWNPYVTFSSFALLKHKHTYINKTNSLAAFFKVILNRKNLNMERII
jgi:hypothetical protein